MSNEVESIIGNMPLLQQPREQRRTEFVVDKPLDFYGARDGKLHANGQVFHIKGINWYGTEGKQMMLEGLHVKPIDRLFDFLVEHEFNAMRLLFNMQDWRDDSPWPALQFSAALNPELVGLSYRHMLLQVTRIAAKRGILVLLACHRSLSVLQSNRIVVAYLIRFLPLYRTQFKWYDSVNAIRSH